MVIYLTPSESVIVNQTVPVSVPLSDHVIPLALMVYIMFISPIKRIGLNIYGV